MHLDSKSLVPTQGILAPTQGIQDSIAVFDWQGGKHRIILVRLVISN